jgi:hypothetical protein
MSSTDAVIESLKIIAPADCEARLTFALEGLAESASSWQPAGAEQIIIAKKGSHFWMQCTSERLGQKIKAKD